MSTINEIIIQYKKQLLVMKDRYIKQISSLPKGTLTVKKMGSGEYWYLKYREGKKIVTKYIGKISDKVVEIEKQIALRKTYERILKELEAELTLIRKFEAVAQGA
ncbi:MAG TPA: hypothetical protein PL054_08470 [Clostridia bacterium]|jgi:hypothetical protein|nr:hypothetical protein [Clostridia bacterium]